MDQIKIQFYQNCKKKKVTTQFSIFSDNRPNSKYLFKIWNDSIIVLHPDKAIVKGQRFNEYDDNQFITKTLSKLISSDLLLNNMIGCKIDMTATSKSIYKKYESKFQTLNGQMQWENEVKFAENLITEISKQEIEYNLDKGDFEILSYFINLMTVSDVLIEESINSANKLMLYYMIIMELIRFRLLFSSSKQIDHLSRFILNMNDLLNQIETDSIRLNEQFINHKKNHIFVYNNLRMEDYSNNSWINRVLTVISNGDYTIKLKIMRDILSDSFEFAIGANELSYWYKSMNKIVKRNANKEIKFKMSFAKSDLNKCNFQFDGWYINNGTIYIKNNTSDFNLRGCEFIKSILRIEAHHDEGNTMNPFMNVLINLKDLCNEISSNHDILNQGEQFNKKMIDFKNCELIDIDKISNRMNEIINDIQCSEVNMDDLNFKFDGNDINEIMMKLNKLKFGSKVSYEILNLLLIFNSINDNKYDCSRVIEDAATMQLTEVDWCNFKIHIMNELNEYLNKMIQHPMTIKVSSDFVYFDMSQIKTLKESLKGNEMNNNIIKMIHKDSSIIWIYNLNNWKQTVYKINHLSTKIDENLMTFGNTNDKIQETEKKLRQLNDEVREFKRRFIAYGYSQAVNYKDSIKTKVEFMNELEQSIKIEKINLREQLNDLAISKLMKMCFTVEVDFIKNQIEMTEDQIIKMSKRESNSILKYAIENDFIKLNNNIKIKLSYFNSMVSKFKKYLTNSKVLTGEFKFRCSLNCNERTTWVDVAKDQTLEFNANTMVILLVCSPGNGSTYYLTIHNNHLEKQNIKEKIKLDEKMYNNAQKEELYFECHPKNYVNVKVNKMNKFGSNQTSMVIGSISVLDQANKQLNQSEINQMKMVVPEKFPPLIIRNLTIKEVVMNYNGEQYPIQANISESYDKGQTKVEVIINLSMLTKSQSTFISQFAIGDEFIDQLAAYNDRIKELRESLIDCDDRSERMRLNIEIGKIEKQVIDFQKKGIVKNMIKCYAYIVQKSNCCEMNHYEFTKIKLKLSPNYKTFDKFNYDADIIFSIIINLRQILKHFNNDVAELNKKLEHILANQFIPLAVDYDDVANYSDIANKASMLCQSFNCDLKHLIESIKGENDIIFFNLNHNSTKLWHPMSYTVDSWLYYIDTKIHSFLIENLIENYEPFYNTEYCSFTSDGNLFFIKSSNCLFITKNLKSMEVHDINGEVNGSDTYHTITAQLKQSEIEEYKLNLDKTKGIDDISTTANLRLWSLCSSFNKFPQIIYCNEVKSKTSINKALIVNQKDAIHQLGLIKMVNSNIGLARSTLKLMKYEPNEEYEITHVDGNLQFPNCLTNYIGPIKCVTYSEYDGIMGQLHKIISNIFLSANSLSKHCYKVEFMTNRTLARDILIDNGFVVELKTQSISNRAKQSYFDSGKHCGEGLIICSRDGLLIDMRTDALINDHKLVQMICNFSTSYHNWRRNQSMLVGTFFDKNLFGENLNDASGIQIQYAYPQKLSSCSLNHGEPKLSKTFNDSITNLIEVPNWNDNKIENLTIQPLTQGDVQKVEFTNESDDLNFNEVKRDSDIYANHVKSGLEKFQLEFNENNLQHELVIEKNVNINDKTVNKKKIILTEDVILNLNSNSSIDEMIVKPLLLNICLCQDIINKKTFAQNQLTILSNGNIKVKFENNQKKKELNLPELIQTNLFNIIVGKQIKSLFEFKIVQPNQMQMFYSTLNECASLNNVKLSNQMSKIWIGVQYSMLFGLKFDFRQVFFKQPLMTFIKKGSKSGFDFTEENEDEHVIASLEGGDEIKIATLIETQNETGLYEMTEQLDCDLKLIYDQVKHINDEVKPNFDEIVEMKFDVNEMTDEINTSAIKYDILQLYETNNVNFSDF